MHAIFFFVKKLLRIIKNYLSILNVVNMLFLVFFLPPKLVGLFHYINLFYVSWRFSSICLPFGFDIVQKAGIKSSQEEDIFTLRVSFLWHSNKLDLDREQCSFFSWTKVEEKYNLESETTIIWFRHCNCLSSIYFSLFEHKLRHSSCTAKSWDYLFLLLRHLA